MSQRSRSRQSRPATSHDEIRAERPPTRLSYSRRSNSPPITHRPFTPHHVQALFTPPTPSIFTGTEDDTAADETLIHLYPKALVDPVANHPLSAVPLYRYHPTGVNDQATIDARQSMINASQRVVDSRDQLNRFQKSVARRLSAYRHRQRVNAIKRIESLPEPIRNIVYGIADDPNKKTDEGAWSAVTRAEERLYHQRILTAERQRERDVAAIRQTHIDAINRAKNDAVATAAAVQAAAAAAEAAAAAAAAAAAKKAADEAEAQRQQEIAAVEKAIEESQSPDAQIASGIVDPNVEAAAALVSVSTSIRIKAPKTKVKKVERKKKREAVLVMSSSDEEEYNGVRLDGTKGGGWAGSHDKMTRRLRRAVLAQVRSSDIQSLPPLCPCHSAVIYQLPLQPPSPQQPLSPPQNKRPQSSPTRSRAKLERPSESPERPRSRNGRQQTRSPSPLDSASEKPAVEAAPLFVRAIRFVGSVNHHYGCLFKDNEADYWKCLQQIMQTIESNERLERGINRKPMKQIHTNHHIQTTNNSTQQTVNKRSPSRSPTTKTKKKP